MPNWTTNAIAVHTPDLPRFVNGDGQVDFDLMRPMPRELLMTCGGIQRKAVAYARGEIDDAEAAGLLPYRDIMPDGTSAETLDELRAVGQRYLDNEARFGHQDWYGWCCEHWGTKWNACETSIDVRGDIAIVVFDTAWARPDMTMFAAALCADGAGGFYSESFDEDYYGIYGTDGDDYLDKADSHIFSEVAGDEEEEGWSYKTAEYDPDVEWLRKRLG